MSSCTLSGEMEEDHAAIFFNKGGKLYAAGIDLSDKSHPIEWRARLFAGMLNSVMRTYQKLSGEISDDTYLPNDGEARLFATVECHRPTDHGVTMVDTLEG